MTRHAPFLIVAAVTLLTAGLPLAGAKGDLPATEPAGGGEAIVYRPPRGAVEGQGIRVESHNGRGQEGDPPRFTVLAPQHVGLTIQEQPSIFWFLSKPAAKPFVLTLLQDDVPEPLLEVKLDGSRPGFQRIDLALLNVKLKVGVKYRISIVLVENGAPRASDLGCIASIQRVEPSDDLVDGLRNRSKEMDRAIVLARQGIWYDALAKVSDQIALDSGNKWLQQQRSRLLEQVQLASFVASPEGGPAKGK